MSRAEYSAGVNSPITKTRRILMFAQELERELVELKNISAIQEEQYKRDNLLLDKKLFSVSKSLDDEVQLNNTLYKDIKLLEQRIKMINEKLNILKKENEDYKKKNDTLQHYVNVKRLAFKKWLKRRLDKRKVKWKLFTKGVKE